MGTIMYKCPSHVHSPIAHGNQCYNSSVLYSCCVGRPSLFLLRVQAREEHVLSTQLQLEQMESEERRRRVAEMEDEISKSKQKAKEFLIDQLVRIGSGMRG